jgi:hypothetical protein
MATASNSVCSLILLLLNVTTPPSGSISQVLEASRG